MQKCLKYNHLPINCNIKNTACSLMRREINSWTNYTKDERNKSKYKMTKIVLRRML